MPVSADIRRRSQGTVRASPRPAIVMPAVMSPTMGVASHRSTGYSDAWFAAGAASTSALTRSGCVAASQAAIVPPRLWPTITAVRAPRASRAASAAPVLPSRSPAGWTASQPGRSMVIAVARAPSRSTTPSQSAALPGCPCSIRTAGGPAWSAALGGGARRATARILADGLTIPSDVAVLSARHHDDGLGTADVAHPSVRGGIDAGKPAGSEDVRRAVAEPELDLAPVHEVRLLLLVVVVDPGHVPGWQDDGVDAERGDAERTADLAEPRPVTDLVQAGHRVSPSVCDLSHERPACYLSDPLPAR